MTLKINRIILDLQKSEKVRHFKGKLWVVFIDIIGMSMNIGPMFCVTRILKDNNRFHLSSSYREVGTMLSSL